MLVSRGSKIYICGFELRCHLPVQIKLEGIDVDGVDTSNRSMSLRKVLLQRGEFDSFRIPILKKVNFEANPGDRIGVIGRNGSGKSSLLKAIAGIYPISSGKRTVVGNIAPLIEMGIGFDPEMSGRQNIVLGLLYSGRIEEHCRELEDLVIEFSELGDHIDLPVKNYSSGMVSRLAFSIAIFQHPDILLLDEVFAAGDLGFVNKSKRIMEDKFTSVPISILVNHSSEEIIELCNKCYWFVDGEVKMVGKPKDVVGEYVKAIG